MDKSSNKAAAEDQDFRVLIALMDYLVGKVAVWSRGI